MADFNLILRDGRLVGVPLVTPVVILCDEKAYNVDGGTFTLGAWRHRDLNTILAGGSYVTLSGNRFTPVAGTWFVEWSCPAFNINSHISRLYNYTAGVAVSLGSVEYAQVTYLVETRTFGSAVISANGTDAYQIEHYAPAYTVATNGFGVKSTASGIASRYTFVTLKKL